ncbi:MAG: FAD-dependent oxidoreductase [Fibrobacteria bacterium]
MPNPKRVVVIGAGPMGLYAAYAAARRGLEVTVLERDRVGYSLATWGSARFFSPLSMNAPAEVLRSLPDAPPGDALLTGPEMIDRVLAPLARLPILYDRIRLRHQVIAIGRVGLSRRDFAGHPVRQEKPFRLLVKGPEGEYALEADLVFDASGAYARCNAMGAGGLPAPGERALTGSLMRRLGDFDAFLSGFVTGHVLLLGHGHSAAHALLALRDAAARNPGVSATWCFRSRNLRPFREMPDDPLPGRAAIVSAANALAAAPPAFLKVRRAGSIAALEPLSGAGGSRIRAFRAVLAGTSVSQAVSQTVSRAGSQAGSQAISKTVPLGASAVTAAASAQRADILECDAVAAFTGHRPDLSFLSELALDLSPATEGTRRLHAVLSGATDCLSVPMPRPEDLDSGETGFFLLGAKSYGRANTFLLRDGIAHLEMILKHALG